MERRTFLKKLLAVPFISIAAMSKTTAKGKTAKSNCVETVWYSGKDTLYEGQLVAYTGWSASTGGTTPFYRVVSAIKDMKNLEKAKSDCLYAGAAMHKKEGPGFVKIYVFNN